MCGERSIEWQSVALASGAVFSHHFAAGTATLLHGGTPAQRQEALQVLSLSAPPAEGEILLRGCSPAAWSPAQCAEWRARHCGRLYPTPFLLPALTVAENLAMPLFRLTELTPAAVTERTEELLHAVHLLPAASFPAGELSLPEQQALALARALAHRPTLLLVEEWEPALGLPPSPLWELLRHALAGEGLTAVLTGPEPCPSLGLPMLAFPEPHRFSAACSV